MVLSQAARPLVDIAYPWVKFLLFFVGYAHWGGNYSLNVCPNCVRNILYAQAENTAPRFKNCQKHLPGFEKSVIAGQKSAILG